jgi:plasmid maintenance system killer protein
LNRGRQNYQIFETKCSKIQNRWTYSSKAINKKSNRKHPSRWEWKIARRKLDQLDFAASLNDLRSPPKNRLEALKGTEKDNTVFALTTSTEFALSGQTMV